MPTTKPTKTGIKIMKKDNAKNTPFVAAENLGAGLKQLILQELKVAPNTWQKMSEKQQAEVIDRVDAHIRYASAAAVNTIASGSQTTVNGVIEGIAIKGKTKITISIEGKNDSTALAELYEAGSGSDCKIILIDNEQYTGGMEFVSIPEPNQGALIDPDDGLLWCVVVPIRSGKSIVAAPSAKQAAMLAQRIRAAIIDTDSDMANMVYAMPWQDNKAAHDRMIKKGDWKRLVEWHKELTEGKIKIEVTGLLSFIPEASNLDDSGAEVSEATQASKSENKAPEAAKDDNEADKMSKEDKEELRKAKKRAYDKQRRADKKKEGEK